MNIMKHKASFIKNDVRKEKQWAQQVKNQKCKTIFIIFVIFFVKFRKEFFPFDITSSFA